MKFPLCFITWAMLSCTLLLFNRSRIGRWIKSFYPQQAKSSGVERNSPECSTNKAEGQDLEPGSLKSSPLFFPL